MCRTPREAGCMMRWTALPRYGKKTRTGLFFVPSRRRCFPRSYGFPAGNVPVSDNIPAGFAVTFLAHFFACPDLFCYLCAAKPGQLPPMRSDAPITAPAVARPRGRRSCRGDVELFYIRVELFHNTPAKRPSARSLATAGAVTDASERIGGNCPGFAAQR